MHESRKWILDTNGSRFMDVFAMPQFDLCSNILSFAKEQDYLVLIWNTSFPTIFHQALFSK